MAKRKRLSPVDPALCVSENVSNTAGIGSVLRRSLDAAPVAGVAADAAARAALDEMQASITQARAEGRMVIEVPLDQIQSGYLPRDRVVLDDEEMTALMDSLRSRGQQTPIEAVALSGGCYGLISGWRRCQALRLLGAESVQVLLRQPQDTAAAILAMVEENEIRANLSYFERALIVVKSVDQGVFETDRDALSGLFGSASRPRRSKIGAFVPIVRALDGFLSFPEAVTERVGLVLSKALQQDPALPGRIHKALSEAAPKDPAAEQAVLKSVLNPSLKTKQQGPDSSDLGAVGEVRLPGVYVARDTEGGLVLRGEKVDDALWRDLVVWLRARVEARS